MSKAPSPQVTIRDGTCVSLGLKLSELTTESLRQNSKEELSHLHCLFTGHSKRRKPLLMVPEIGSKFHGSLEGALVE